MQTTFLYNAELTKMRAAFLADHGIGTDAIVTKSGLCRVSVERAIDGRLRTLEKLRKVSDAMGLSWELLFRENLTEIQIRRAVRATVR